MCVFVEESKLLLKLSLAVVVNFLDEGSAEDSMKLDDDDDT